ncbi:MAG: hypothetical protein D6814_13155, partial [Calditrichaeota bacterium]
MIHSQIDYREKFEAFVSKTLFDRLDTRHRAFLRQVAFRYHLTFQEFRQLVEMSVDLSMWGEGDIIDWWQRHANSDQPPSRQNKKMLLRE